jgi:hypothetical protein
VIRRVLAIAVAALALLAACDRVIDLSRRGGGDDGGTGVDSGTGLDGGGGTDTLTADDGGGGAPD